MTDKLTSMLKFWPVLMLCFAGVSSGFAFYHSMQALQDDVQELKQMLVRRESIELELKVRDTEIEQLKSWMRLQETLTRDIESDITDLYRMTK